MESGQIAGGWGHSLRAATVDWIPAGPDGEPGEPSPFGNGKEALAPAPLTNWSSSPRFAASRCMECRLIVFRF